MKRMVFGESVQGASHKRVDKECQDSFKKLEYDDGTVIMAIADGHGSKACPYSKSGSSIAVNVFCKVMDEFHASYAENLEMLLTYLNREGDTKVAQAVDAEWKRRVLKVHTNQKREVLLTEDGEKNKAEIYKQYGSTLVGLMITPIFVFAFQLGDGDISYVDQNGLDHLLEDEKILGVETHSLSKIDSWKKVVSAVRRRDEADGLPYMLMISTVLKVHTNQKREVLLTEDGEKNKAEIYKQYGSTLVGLMITPIFVFAFQLGDGDISYVDQNGLDHLLEDEKILGVETHSLSKIDSWKKVVSAVRRRDEADGLPYMLMLSTDGFANSYKNADEFQKTCVDYFAMIQQYGADAVAANLKSWLSETSAMGCGDDITVLIAYFSDDATTESEAAANE